MLNFYFLEKGLELVILPYFVCDFSRKMFPMLILVIDKISLLDCLKITFKRHIENIWSCQLNT